MAAPFPEAVLAPVIYFFLGMFTLSALIAAYYFRKLYLDGEEEDLGIDRIGLSHRAERVLGEILEEPVLQSELPDRLEVSKATVSQAVTELNDRRLVRKKKKANTYLIEPRMDVLKEEE